MYENGKLYMGLSDPAKEKVYMYLSQANRHGLIAGASGTGKTITMKVMATSFQSSIWLVGRLTDILEGCLHCRTTSLIAQLIKNPPAMQETLVQFLGQENVLEKG